MTRIQCWHACMRIFAGALVCLSLSMPASAAAPMLYRQPAYQSPVRGEPDDLLLLAGYGYSEDDTVVYRSVADTTDPPQHPPAVPDESDAALGIAEVVSRAAVPHALTVRLPKVMRSGQSYALWVRNAANEWSKPVLINDARPYWLTPAFAYSSAALASLPRYLKVVGRNLQPASGSTTRVRLLGPQTLVLDAMPASNAALDHYVARVELPKRLPPGRYRVQLSRDGASWLELAEQTLEIRPDPASAATFAVDGPAYGACRPDDGQDDTPCVVRAVAAAWAAGGGNVLFARGTWNLSATDALGVHGIVLPKGVGLQGAGPLKTRIVRDARWSDAPNRATFTLTGRNVVSAIGFRDAHRYQPNAPWGPMLRLGPLHGEAAAEAVEDVIITGNSFDRVQPAVTDSGAPLARLFITYNEFGAFASALYLSGNRFNVAQRFRIDDSVVSHNTFKPGSHIDIASRQGAIATELGAGWRVDFSNNVADGTATDYLYSDQDARGWRAAYFWHMNGNQEMVLVSQNSATCTGDKAGDGEGIAYDANGNTMAFESARIVTGATQDSVTVAGSLEPEQNQRKVPLDTYYSAHWIQVGEGPGLGQVRKIRSYRIDREQGSVTFTLTAPWDVVPVPQRTRISAGREFWQLYTVANTVDNREPLCLKSNRTERKGGVIGLWAQAADSAIEGNVQFDSDGILLQQLYSARDEVCGCNSWTHYVHFVEIRGNTIDGEYDWRDSCGSAGIAGSIGLSPTPRSPAQTASYGLSIAHNTVRRSDSKYGGAISFATTWYQGPWPHRWPVVDNVLIHHNTLSELQVPPGRRCNSDRPRPSVAINFADTTLMSRTVLYANSCTDASTAASAGWQKLTRVCPDGVRSCECE